ncbi:isopentenyl-diphosphate delta-isomerase, partial [Edhazardia aedis USNM 41457]
MKLPKTTTILVDKHDKIIGSKNIVDVHMKGKSQAHRGFSAFIFQKNPETKNLELLIQQRSSKKLVNPRFWTNSVSSHPFLNELSFTDPILDCKNFLIERIGYELGIDDFVVKDKLFLYNRIFFKTGLFSNRLYSILDSNVKPQPINTDILNSATQIETLYPIPKGDTQNMIYWQDHRMEYVFFALIKNFTICKNSDEIEVCHFISEDELRTFRLNYQFSYFFTSYIREFNVFEIMENRIRNSSK